MSVGQNRLACSELRENAVNLSDVSAFVASCVKFSVRESAGSAFPEAVIGVCVQNSFVSYKFYVFFAALGISSAVNEDWLYSVLKEPECGVKSCWTCSDDYNAFFFVCLLPFGKFFVLVRSFVYENMLF